MKIPELIKRLQKVEDEHGPLEIRVSADFKEFEVFLLTSKKEKIIIIKQCK